MCFLQVCIHTDGAAESSVSLARALVNIRPRFCSTFFNTRAHPSKSNTLSLSLSLSYFSKITDKQENGFRGKTTFLTVSSRSHFIIIVTSSNKSSDGVRRWQFNLSRPWRSLMILKKKWNFSYLFWCQMQDLFFFISDFSLSLATGGRHGWHLMAKTV